MLHLHFLLNDVDLQHFLVHCEPLMHTASVQMIDILQARLSINMHLSINKLLLPGRTFFMVCSVLLSAWLSVVKSL